MRIAVRAADGRTRLADLAQRGSARCLIPRVPGRIEAVLLNTAGGITGGDRFDWEAEAGPGATLTLATQTAERLYRAEPGAPARVATRLTVGDGARLDWLAQETILFEGCAVERRLEAEIAGDATLTVLEPLILGRAAMGEKVRTGHFTDDWRIRRAGRLIYADALRLCGPVAEIAVRPACWGPNRAAASLLHIAPGAEGRLAPLRRAIATAGIEGGASAWDGILACRLLAPDGRRLRAALLALLPVLRRDPLPRVWTM